LATGVTQDVRVIVHYDVSSQFVALTIEVFHGCHDEIAFAGVEFLLSAANRQVTK
jgi:hypothetical protein